ALEAFAADLPDLDRAAERRLAAGQLVSLIGSGRVAVGAAVDLVGGAVAGVDEILPASAIERVRAVGARDRVAPAVTVERGLDEARQPSGAGDLIVALSA